ncbi:MAG: hypothetical protein MJ075_01930 [Oscillospiraceae bacterium]|nr:hypothetical protein [Oscillospiraceae bacterium]
MKKLLSILLAMLLVVSLCACGATAEKPAEETKPAETETPAAEPETPAEDAEAPADDAEAPADDAEAPVAAGIGYVTDDVDHWARDEYSFCYCYTSSGALNDNMMDVFRRLGKVYNFSVHEMNGNNNPENYIQGIEVEYNKGTDGLLVDCDPVIMNRCYELLNELEIPYVSLFNPMCPDQEALQVCGPSVVLDQARSGRDTMQYYYDRLNEYWGDVDMSKVALLNLNYSTSPAFQQRVDGSTEKFSELFPDCAILEADGVTAGSLNAEVGYDLTSQIISANPQYDHWIVFACVEYYAQGATRYAETTANPSNILITCSGSNTLPQEFESGYDATSWKVAYAVSDICYGGPAALGLIAICDGRATEETLWADRILDGDVAASYIADPIMLTIDNWTNFKDDMWAIYDPEGIGA